MMVCLCLQRNKNLEIERWWWENVDFHDFPLIGIQRIVLSAIVTFLFINLFFLLFMLILSSIAFLSIDHH